MSLFCDTNIAQGAAQKNSMNMNMHSEYKNVIVCREKLSPFWIAQWTDGRVKRVRRSTKVPVGGGVYKAERLSAAQAERRALLVAYKLAQASEEVYATFDNTTVREVCAKMLAGKLGHVSLRTYANARTDYKQFLTWLGARADEPIRFITRADMKDWINARRAEVRAKTVRKALTAPRRRARGGRLPPPRLARGIA